MTLQILRGLFMALALLVGMTSCAILIMPGQALDMGVTDGMFLMNMVLFFFTTSLWVVFDATHHYNTSITENWKRIYKRSIVSGLIAVAFSIVAIIVLISMNSTIFLEVKNLISNI